MFPVGRAYHKGNVGMLDLENWGNGELHDCMIV